MPSTVTPRIYTGAFPTITANDLKYTLYAVSDPLAEVSSQTFSPPHLARMVSFPGLDRVNYTFKLYKMAAGVPIETLATFEFNPDNSEFLYRAPEILEVGSTIGLIDGATTFTFDGTGGKPDWRGWIPIMQPPGFGPLLKGYNYSWNSTTGLFTLTDGSVFTTGVRYLAEFQPKTVAGAPGVPSGRLFTDVMEITASTTLVAADMGKKILIKPATPYIEITWPAIATAVQNRVTFVETVPQGAGSRFCVAHKAAGTDEWQFGKLPRTTVYQLPGESFEVYKYAAFGNPAAWRVQNAVGNFLSVGHSFGSDATTELNAQLFDGSTGDVEKDARIWNEFILQLDGAQVCSYADWESTVANQTKFSLQNSDVPAKFHFPDRRNLHERNTSAAALAGAYQADQLLKHRHIQDTGALDHLNGGSYGHTDVNFLIGTYGGPVSGPRGITSRSTGITQTDGGSIDGDENRVKNYSINRFCKL